MPIMQRILKHRARKLTLTSTQSSSVLASPACTCCFRFVTDSA